MSFRKKRTYLFVGVAVLLILSAWILMKNNQSPESISSVAAAPAGNADNPIQKAKAHALLQTHPFNEALQLADNVSELTIVSNAGEIDEPSAKTIFTAEVTKNFKGDVLPGETIYILQDGNSKVEFNHIPFQSGEKFVLILKKATGFTDNTYWILGGETGVYQIVDDNTIVKWAKVDEQLKNVEIEDDKQAKNGIQVEFETKDTQLLNKEQFEQFIESELKG